MIDLESLLKAISPESPCGDDLEYDPAFGALERLTQGRPEQRIGETVVPAEEPNWIEVQRQAADLLGRTKDLRIAAILTRALVRTQGWEGLRDGLGVFHGLLDRYWETLNPPLDPDDGNDPTLRVNTVTSLCDPGGTLDPLRTSPLVVSPAFGRLSLRDLQIARNSLAQPTGSESSSASPDWPTIEAAFKDADLATLQACANAIEQSGRLIADIESLLLERVGASAAPDLTPLIELTKAAFKAVIIPISERTGHPVSAEDPSLESLASTLADLPVGGQPAPKEAPLVTITNRSEVIRALDLVCEYYQREEPSSPLPFLIRRARRLVSKDFLEILRDLAPSSLSQAEEILGHEPDEPV